MNRVSRARRNQAYIYNRPRRPRIALVDEIAMFVNLQRAVEVRSGIDRSAGIGLAAPEEHLALVVHGFHLYPGLGSVHSATRKKVSNLAGAHDNVDARAVAATDGSVHLVERSAERRDFSGRLARGLHLCFLAHGKCRLQLRLRSTRSTCLWAAVDSAKM